MNSSLVGSGREKQRNQWHLHWKEMIYFQKVYSWFAWEVTQPVQKMNTFQLNYSSLHNGRSFHPSFITKHYLIKSTKCLIMFQMGTSWFEDKINHKLKTGHFKFFPSGTKRRGEREACTSLTFRHAYSHRVSSQLHAYAPFPTIAPALWHIWD